MKALPITIFYLLLMALLAYGALNTGLDRLVELKAVQGALEAQRGYHNAWEQTVYLVQKGKQLPGRPKPTTPKGDKDKKGGEGKPRPIARPIVYPTKLNLAKAEKKDRDWESYRKVCEKLLQELYSDYPPFQQFPKAEEALIERLLKEIHGAKMTLPEHLATLDLGDLQPLWQKLLMGDDCHPLLDYFYYKTSKKKPEINVTWAPKPLLKVLIKDEGRVQQLLELQEQLAKHELEGKDIERLKGEYESVAKVEKLEHPKILKCGFPTKAELLTTSGSDDRDQFEEKKMRFW